MEAQQTSGDRKGCDRLVEAIERDVIQELYDGGRGDPRAAWYRAPE